MKSSHTEKSQLTRSPCQCGHAHPQAPAATTPTSRNHDRAHKNYVLIPNLKKLINLGENLRKNEKHSD